MLRRFVFRAFTQLDDPAVLTQQLTFSKYSGRALNLFMQSEAFEMSTHAPVLIESLHRCKNRGTKELETYDNLTPKKLLVDARYQNFVKKLLGEIDSLKTYNKLAWLYFDGEQTFPQEVEAKVVQLINRSIDTGSVEDLMVAASTIALALPQQRDLGLKIVTQVVLRNKSIVSVDGLTIAGFVQALAKLRIRDQKVMKILEPYIISKSHGFTGKVLVQVLNSYKKLHCGTPEFFSLLTFNINSKAGELAPNDITLALHQMSMSKDFSISQAKFMVLEILKKLNDVSAKDLEVILKLMLRCRMGETDYYELLVIQVLKLQDSFSMDSLISVLDCLAMADVNSKGLFKLAVEEGKKFLLKHTSIILGEGKGFGTSLAGIISKEQSAEVSYELLEQALLADITDTESPEIDTKQEESQARSFAEKYAETKLPVYSFSKMIDLAWSITALAMNSQEQVDSEAWMLIVLLLNKHISEAVGNHEGISYTSYDKLAQIAWFTKTYFPTTRRVDPFPASNVIYKSSSALVRGQLYEDNREFAKQLTDLCRRRQWTVNLPPEIEDSTNRSVTPEGVLNILGDDRVIVARAYDQLIEPDRLIKPLSLKATIMGPKTKLLKFSDWQPHKSRDYLEKLIDSWSTN
mmetsp:Transcript_26499/g.47568  ORF Transcript_26499/g.47568 Transcript_26499/m.47568 type:complete len:633 (-) Transcript_26499:1473-3371(-)